MFALIANGPALFPTPGAPASEWVIWGACASVAVLLGGWGLLNLNRPERDTRVGMALLGAMVLTAFAILFVTARGHLRQVEENRAERESRNEGQRH